MGNRHFTDTELRAVALCEADGRGQVEMVRLSGLSLVRVKNILAGKMRVAEKALYGVALKQCAERLALAELKHISEMTRLAPKAYLVLDQAVTGFENNPELAYRAARDILRDGKAPIHEAGGTNQQANTIVNAQVNLMDGKAADAIGGFIESVAATTQQMKTPLGNVRDHNSRVHTSSAAEAGSNVHTKGSEAVVEDVEIVEEK